MNVFNRVLIVILLLGLIVALVVSAVLPMTVVAWLQALGRGADELVIAPVVYIRLGVTAVLLVLAVVLLVLELRRPQRHSVVVQQAGGSVVEVGVDSIARSLEYYVGQVPGVVKVRPSVASQGKRVQVMLDLELDPMADLRAKSEEVIQLAQELVESKLGLKLSAGGLRVKVRQAPYGPGVGPRPEPPATQLPPVAPTEPPATGSA